MNTSGDAAEQIVRLSLEGMEVALKLSGSAAKNIAAMLYAMSKDTNYPKAGKVKIKSMVKTGKPMTAYTLRQSDCAEFCRQAKSYGITYCPIAYKKDDGTVDVLIFESDAARANRIVERFKLATVDAASVKSEIQRSRQEQAPAPATPQKSPPEKSEEERLLDEILPIQKEAPANPTAARAEKFPPSEPTSGKPGKTAEGTAKKQERPSVRQELREIQSQRRQEAAAVPPAKETEPVKKQAQKPAQHLQPPKKNKSKGR